ncbi:MAG: hypothetical protein K9J37_16975, partial [Saprospiraceae bacterium]|nr:hypothetical protein [Saprospiraceae bacterium]MCF8251610.1 hypothetical protein [Saprospiraceae bacterium]MCF8282072.1 hypothetical protein [Bacteroidales bacterium]MCF8313505.1 hypothetical protein [Saprospiraceae bacterium]MCF8442246.1 hypothetical protein [Saprospiraceae bacterium]
PKGAMFLPTDNSTLQLSIVDWSVKLLLSPLFLTYILSSIGVNELLCVPFLIPAPKLELPDLSETQNLAVFWFVPY